MVAILCAYRAFCRSAAIDKCSPCPSVGKAACTEDGWKPNRAGIRDNEAEHLVPWLPTTARNLATAHPDSSNTPINIMFA